MDNNAFYATDVKIATTPYHMLLDISCNIPEDIQENKEQPAMQLDSRSRIFLSPEHFKKLAKVMTTVYEDYEKRFGKIPEEKT